MRDAEEALAAEALHAVQRDFDAAGGAALSVAAISPKQRGGFEVGAQRVEAAVPAAPVAAVAPLARLRRDQIR